MLASLPIARIIAVVIFRSLWSLHSKVGEKRIREGLILFELHYRMIYIIRTNEEVREKGVVRAIEKYLCLF